MQNEQLTLDKTAKSDIMDESIIEKLVIPNINANNADVAEHVITPPKYFLDSSEKVIEVLTVIDKHDFYKNRKAA